LSASAGGVLPGSIHLNAAATSSWAHHAWGDTRVGYGRIGLARNAPAGLVVEPALHVVDVDAQSDQRWYGASCRVEGRGMEARMDNDFGRRQWWMLRKDWRRSHLRATLGAQLVERAGARDRRLLEIGAGAGAFSVHWYPANDQHAVLLGVGPVQVGYGRRAAHRQLVLGVGSLSLSCFESPDGPAFGLGFVYGQWARHMSRAAHGWQWAPAQHVNALREPQQRWPRFATNLD
jgi:hypothetical protein